MGDGPALGRARLRWIAMAPFVSVTWAGLGCGDGAVIQSYPGASGAVDPREGGAGPGQPALEIAATGELQTPGVVGAARAADAGLEPTPSPGNAPGPGQAPAAPVEPAENAAGGDGAAPALRSPVSQADEALARQALALLGSGAVGASGSCSTCHGLGRPTLTRWLGLTRVFTEACLTQPELPDVEATERALGCFDTHAEAGLVPASFGIYAAAAHLPWFEFVFSRASGAGAARYADFIARVAMPRAGDAWTQPQFDVVAEWFARGLPYLFELVPEDSGSACSGGVDPRLVAHVARMRESGWRARNEQTPLLMFGCDGGEPAGCLAALPLARDVFGQSWDLGGASSRILHDTSDTPTNYWSRCSADGRFIASGLRGGGLTYHGQFIDLEGPRTLAGDFSYDPTFFPDNSGFLLQRVGYGSGAGGATTYRQVAIACNQSVLGGDSTTIGGSEPECDEVDAEIGLYQQVARALDGGDPLVVFGSFVDDNGGITPTLENPPAAFESRSAVSFTRLINSGSSFAPGPVTRVPTPLAGDPMLSPSGGLLVMRTKGLERTQVVDGQRLVHAEQSGYSLLLVTASEPGVSPALALAEVGRVCQVGGKPSLSYDERWMVLHHYVTDDDAAGLGFTSADDPGFADYRALGASNLVLVDLLDGSSRSITRMAPGQYAVFPHFRSDGWIYYVLRTLQGEEYFVATDAAVLLEPAP